MSSTSSTSDASSGEIMDDTPVTRRGRGRKRGLSRGGSRDSSRGGSRGRSRDSSRGGRRGGRRGGGRGAGTSKGKSVDVTDKQRVEEMWEQRKTQMKATNAAPDSGSRGLGTGSEVLQGNVGKAQAESGRRQQDVQTFCLQKFYIMAAWASWGWK